MNTTTKWVAKYGNTLIMNVPGGYYCIEPIAEYFAATWNANDNPQVDCITVVDTIELAKQAVADRQKRNAS